ncbi:MAG: 1,4-dihydroxy-2-naphthoate octaprenyltransferase [Pseudoflavonifractor sp.]|nr:1,4-dihydroxy-2-naphthoate octaprenyltransferase [Alloprevotella sp.]MCM1115964.1 1,4-dihydroxy-2-naphthoate octaprenyltransferase [Pseudoflavonifractor sp.]
MNPWIEAMRLRTLPVSLAGVTAGIALAAMAGTVKVAPALLCLLFALLAQVASNFANEYFDYRDGLDAPGRVGPRRGVTEGDITPTAMRLATFATLGAACIVGLLLLPYGGWWLIPAGIAVALGVLAYSAGPYPLSRHALGEVAVVAFFGLAPVTLTCRLVSGQWGGAAVWSAALGIGIMGALVLVVNNFRDREDDSSSGKTTIATLWPRHVIMLLYLLGGVAGILLTLPAWLCLPLWWLIVPAAAMADHWCNFVAFARAKGRGFNPLLGRTSLFMAAQALALLLASLT